jgi:prophage antirepressor-like protein
MIIINESGLYSLILRSKMPAARQFQQWVTAEVLPTMRKIGFSHSMEILKAENERLKGLNNKLTKENYELNTAYNGLQQSFANQSVDFAFNTDARNQIIEKIMSVSWLTPEQKQFLIKYEGE